MEKAPAAVRAGRLINRPHSQNKVSKSISSFFLYDLGDTGLVLSLQFEFCFLLSFLYFLISSVSKVLLRLITSPQFRSPQFPVFSVPSWFLCDFCGKDFDFPFAFLRVSVPPW